MSGTSPPPMALNHRRAGRGVRASAPEVTAGSRGAGFLHRPGGEEALHDLGGLPRELLRSRGEGGGWWWPAWLGRELWVWSMPGPPASSWSDLIAPNPPLDEAMWWRSLRRRDCWWPAFPYLPKPPISASWRTTARRVCGRSTLSRSAKNCRDSAPLRLPPQIDVLVVEHGDFRQLASDPVDLACTGRPILYLSGASFKKLKLENKVELADYSASETVNVRIFL